jgi:hypothetical protein
LMPQSRPEQAFSRNQIDKYLRPCIAVIDQPVKDPAIGA